MSFLIYTIVSLYAIIMIYFLIRSFPRLYCWSHAFKAQEKLCNKKQNKLAVLIPARNESMSVGTLAVAKED